jgi:BirA family biotin operon repressor/biotin-[acetyl-CoA-carboxylase] ligase
MRLDADVIRRTLDEAAVRRLGMLEVFGEIESTNSYLMHQPSPAPGQIRVAVTDNQTAGRGRHGRTWLSPPGSGLCLSMAYSFAVSPDNLPALTLAIGLGVIDSLKGLGVGGVQLKWPNDLIAMDGKLGGILTEAQTQTGSAVTVVTGIGLNIDLSEQPEFVVETEWARRIVDLKSQVVDLPGRNVIASNLISGLSNILVDYEAAGFAQFGGRWQQHDWLLGRAIMIDSPTNRISGIGAGIADDGALLVDTRSSGRQRITTGTVMAVDTQETGS